MVSGFDENTGFLRPSQEKSSADELLGAVASPSLKKKKADPISESPKGILEGASSSSAGPFPKEPGAAKSPKSSKKDVDKKLKKTKKVQKDTKLKKSKK